MDFQNVPKSHTDLLHSVFDQSTEGFQVIDKDWRYVFVNEAVAKQGKSGVEDLIGHTMMEKYPGIEKTPLFTELTRVMDKKVGIKMENEFVFPNGEKGWFELFIHPWSDGIMIFSVDITGRKFAGERISRMIDDIKESATSPVDKEKIEDLKKAFQELSKPTVTIISR